MLSFRFQQEFLDHGDWSAKSIEEFARTSLPNINIHEAILKILTDV
jgi:hypothetical protein